MGNEESQQGGAQGPQQQGAPGTFGMGQPQQPARFGGPPGPMGPPPGMRQVAPTGRPNLRPGGPGPPQATRGPFPGGGPRQPQQAGPARPVQVGVQPWAEPPVQQPAQFRGPSPRPSMMQPPQQPVQKAVVQPPKVQPQPEMDIGVDLSNLSEEEKAKILSVMARAQDLDQDYERHKRAKEEPSEVRPQLLCPLCQRVDLAVETNKMCGDCGKNFCQKCGTFVPGEGRRSVWVCNTCSNRRKQEQLRKEQEQQRLQQQGNTTGTGQMVAGDPSRKDETMSREYRSDAVGDVVSVSQEYRRFEDEDDGWGGFGGGSSSGDSDGFSDRTSSIRRMLEEEDEDEDEDPYGSDEGEGGGGGSLPFYDRSPGEVYTIQEEEEEDSVQVVSSSSTAWDGELLNPDTASSLIRWRGMGQPFQNLQQQQQQPGGQQQLPGAQVQQQPSVSLLGTGTSGGGSLMSGSLIPSSAVGGRGTLPRTVPLTAVSQQQWPQNTQQQQWPNMQTTMQQQQPMMQGGGGTQQTMVMTQQLQPKAVDMMTPQQQQQQKQQVGSGLMMKKGEQSSSSDWSPVTDLSPILDVSPSLEAAEQELMEKCVQQDQQLRPGGIPRAQSGTISSLLADFNKSVGQTTPTIDDGSRSLTIMQQPQQQTQQQTHQQVQMQQQQPVGTTSMTASQQKTALSTGGTEMDQNQNLVQQHQFQLQQQQLMIQQQQQVIQQQQAQLQQQMQQQQIQTQQYQTQQQQQQQQVMMQHDMAQQQHSMQMQQPQQTMTTSLVPQQQQQQPGMVVAGTPMQQQQAPSQRKVHRRLPQPTVDQMQAAVALAAQTPRSKSQSSNRGMQPSIGGFHRPVSPVIIAGTTSTSAASLGVATAQHLPSAVSPTPRKDLSETTLSLDGIDGVGGKKVRRRLPPVPLDQEPTTVPLRRIKDRNRTLSMPLSTSADRGAWDTRRMPQRTTSLDDGMSLTMKTSTGSILDTLGLASHTTSTDTYLKLLGILASTTTTTTTTTTSILDSIPSSIGLSTSLLGRRDLSAPHSLSLYRDVSSTSGSYLLDSEPKLPSYLLSLKQQLREELRSVSDHNRRRITDPDLSGLLSHSTWPSDTSSYDPLRKLGSSSASTLPLTGGSRLAARRSRHRRHASDTKLATLSLGREEALDDPLMSRYKLYQGGSTMPFKSYEFESIDDHLGPSYGYSSGGRHHHYPPRRRSSLTDMNDLTGLRDTALNTALGHTSRSSTTDQALRRYNREIARLRRHTDTGLGSLSLSSLGLDPYGRHNSATYGRGVNVRPAASRSWHPSPYVSEDEDEREEKKAKIKAEIARRRQHLEESARLHDPMYKMSAGYPTASSYDRLYGSPVGSFADDPDLLMMRRDAYRTNLNYPAYPATYPSYRSSSTRYGDVSSWPYDPYAYADDLVDPYDLDVYSPLDPDSDPLVAPMPLLPDMPTRSRRLLHDLGSTPLGPTRHHQSRAGVSSSQPYEDYEGRVDEPPPRHHRSGGTRPPPQSTSERDVRKAQSSKTSQKYDFPVKRILLTRDPKDRSVSGNGLGMKVVGGKEIPGSNGMIGAYVARIYPGGVVETLGEVREGDQVLEWNGTSLTGKTYEEVQRIIATSGDEVEIVIRSDFNMLSSRSSSHHPPNRHHHHEQQNHHPESRLSRSGGHHQHSTTSRSAGGSSSYHHHQQQQQHSQSSYRTSRDRYDEYAVRSPTEEGVRNSNCLEERCGSVSPTRHHPRIGSPVGKADTTDNKEKYRAEDISGEIQLQVCYDSKASILYVTIVRARNLVTSRDNSGLPDPYVKCYLLPDRRVENQRRTRYFSRCSNPEWKQTMVYPQVPQDQLKKKYLEISVWNYDINGPPEFLGETILDLKDTSVIDEQSRWYKLHPHDPKKYPSQSLNNEGAMKMARLNNPNKNALYLDNDDIRKSNYAEKKFFKQLTRKSTANESYTRASEQSELAGPVPVHGQHHGPPAAAAGLPRRRMQSPMSSSLSHHLGSPVLAIEA